MVHSFILFFLFYFILLGGTMKKLLVVTALGLFFIYGCSEPCETALNKAKKCLKKAGKPLDKGDPPKFLLICKGNKKAFEKCNKLSDCAEFQKCISEAGSQKEAVKDFKKLQNNVSKEKSSEKPVKKVKVTKPTMNATSTKPTKNPTVKTPVKGKK
jgi:hypothetical protein